jgi:hypothetical protein
MSAVLRSVCLLHVWLRRRLPLKADFNNTE